MHFNKTINKVNKRIQAKKKQRKKMLCACAVNHFYIFWNEIAKKAVLIYAFTLKSIESIQP